MQLEYLRKHLSKEVQEVAAVSELLNGERALEQLYDLDSPFYTQLDAYPFLLKHTSDARLLFSVIQCNERNRSIAVTSLRNVLQHAILRLNRASDDLRSKKKTLSHLHNILKFNDAEVFEWWQKSKLHPFIATLFRSIIIEPSITRDISNILVIRPGLLADMYTEIKPLQDKQDWLNGTLSIIGELTGLDTFKIHGQIDPDNLKDDDVYLREGIYLVSGLRNQTSLSQTEVTELVFSMLTGGVDVKKALFDKVLTRFDLLAEENDPPSSIVAVARALYREYLGANGITNVDVESIQPSNIVRILFEQWQQKGGIKITGSMLEKIKPYCRQLDLMDSGYLQMMKMYLPILGAPLASYGIDLMQLLQEDEPINIEEELVD